MIKRIPNILSISRIILTIFLIFLEPFLAPFMIVYILAVISDLIDGPLARKIGATSQFGANLDGFADFFLIIVVLFRVWPQIEFSAWLGMWIFGVIALKLLSLLVAFIRYKKLALLHTYANKFFVLVLATFPIFEVLLNNSDIWLTAFLVIATLAMLEDVFINLTSKELDLDIKGIFFR
ncbi:MAG: CDP-alcohol phosphatidyltransferase family protein [Defluviitaleaceae bacterium]|nr:CDP-alcohol phosphatidyltransferase family protein [Defluviitaleaceae bacterium]